MKLYIIGNGFDQAHDLPTAYWDFRTYLEKTHPDFLESFEQKYEIYPGASEEYKRNLLWNDFETNLANINESVIIENALALDMGLESGPVGIEDTLREYFRNEYKYIDLLAGYLKHWVRTIRIRDTLPIVSSILKTPMTSSLPSTILLFWKMYMVLIPAEFYIFMVLYTTQVKILFLVTETQIALRI